MSFTLQQTDPGTRARIGLLRTSHGVIETPAFMPVGTQGSVKAVCPGELIDAGLRMILGNVYHLSLRPGAEAIRAMGGLHRFIGWDGAILTDSGGYQVFSLASLRRIDEEGVRFRNHLDGATHLLTPEVVMEIQRDLGSDVAMVLDECPPHPCPREHAERGVALTLRWAARAREWVERARAASEATPGQLVFGIVQGSTHADLRERCARELVAMGWDGHAIGGVSVGESEAEMMAAADATVPHLPEGKPRYAMGLGTPRQIVRMVARGIDLFDCVLPTRMARNGAAFTAGGTLNLRNRRFALDPGPLEEGCACPACRGFSRAYIRHLLRANEILGLRLMTLHNLHHYSGLMGRIREAIRAGTFAGFADAYAPPPAPSG